MPNMDDYYESLFGVRPSKTGKGYELIVASVMQALNKQAKVTHDVFHPSSYSNDTHQIDSLVEDVSGKIFVETKDYQDRGASVGRPDVAKLAGSLLVLSDVNEGLLASATDFTKPAKQYVEDLRQAGAKPIDLYIIRPSTDEDEEGRIKTIRMNMHATVPDYSHARWQPVLKPEAMQVLSDAGYKEGEVVDTIHDGFYNKDGRLIKSVKELTSVLKLDDDKMVSEGSWEFEEDAFIYIGSCLVPIDKFHYQIPYVSFTESFEINAGEPSVLVQSLDRTVDKIISVDDLKDAHHEILQRIDG